MKKSLLLLASLALFLSLTFISAATCTLAPQLINQDPYPAVPGDYVKLVFQVNGIQNPDCSQVVFQLVPNYPISFDPGVSSIATINSGTYTTSNYNSFVMVPYRVRIDPNAISGNNTIEFDYKVNAAVGNTTIINYFNLNIQDVRSDFEVFVKNYDYATKDITLEILNIGKNDVQSLTVTLPPNQENVNISGTNTYIVGSLSSNDFTTADFEISPNKASISMIVSYNDITDVRRSVNKTVYFDPGAFKKPQQIPATLYIIAALVALIVVYIFYRRNKKNKRRKLLRE